ncbi:hypothetical protein LXL04_023303 [Taraxacum kok-saghyz]
MIALCVQLRTTIHQLIRWPLEFWLLRILRAHLISLETKLEGTKCLSSVGRNIFSVEPLRDLSRFLLTFSIGRTLANQTPKIRFPSQCTQPLHSRAQNMSELLSLVPVVGGYGRFCPYVGGWFLLFDCCHCCDMASDLHSEQTDSDTHYMF